MLIAPPAQKQDDGPRRHENPGGMSGKPGHIAGSTHASTGAPHAVGGAISSRARPLASGPIWVTATAAITTITAITTNTAVRPKPCWIHRKDGIATKAPTRPAAWQSPKPEARALVGNTSEMKICEEFPANWMKKIIPNPIASTIASLPALAQSSPNTAVRRKAVTAVGLRPKRSSEYIMKALAHGKARVIQKIEFSGLAIGKPRSTRMFGSQAPSPSAMPKKAKRQIIPAITRPGYSRRTMPSGSLLISLAAPVRSDTSGTVRIPMRCEPGGELD